MISIITPVYKAEAFIDRCIQSILNQTHTDWELILVNDGSPDRSLEICQRYAEAEPRIRVFSQHNQGASVARNLALEKARGEYIAFLDSDDSLEPDTLEHALSALEEHPECDVVQFPMLIDIGHRNERLGYAYNRIAIGQEAQLELMLISEEASWWNTNKLFRRSTLEGLSFIPGMLYEDNLICLQAVLRSRGMVLIDKGQYNYFWNDASTTSSPSAKSWVDMVIAHGKMYQELVAVNARRAHRFVLQRNIAMDIHGSYTVHKHQPTDVTRAGLPYLQQCALLDILFARKERWTMRLLVVKIHLLALLGKYS